MYRFFAAALLLLAVVPCGMARAAMTESDAVRIVLTSPQVPGEMFSASFLAQVPASQLTPIRDQVVAPLGQFERSDGANGHYTAYFTKGTLQVFIHLDAGGKIDSLLLRDPVVTGGNLKDALAKLSQLPGATSYIVLQGSTIVAQENQTKALGVGSTFKLAVLNALRKQITAGRRHWNDVVTLKEGWKSLPSGVLQGWPAGTPVTLASLATQMISISDNTAADTLAHVAGARAIAPFAAGNTPFLTTRQMFLLKTRGNEALRARYRSGSPRERAAVLAEIDKQPLPAIDRLDTSPALSDIEWHFTNRELCTLMQGVQDLPLMTVNPGVASPSQWKRIAYKGGSDFGVISMTTWVQNASGTSYCVSATWNNPAAQVDEAAFASAYASIFSALAALK